MGDVTGGAGPHMQLSMQNPTEVSNKNSMRNLHLTLLIQIVLLVVKIHGYNAVFFKQMDQCSELHDVISLFV